MTKKILFYGMIIELHLRNATNKEVSRYIRRKLEEDDYYIQKKHDGTYIYYYSTNTGYYLCVFSFTGPLDDDIA